MPRRLDKLVPAGALLILLWWMVGCRTVEQPPPRAFNVVVRHFAGTPLTGPDNPENLVETGESASVEVTFFSLPTLPGDLFDPAAERAQMILLTGESIELMPTLVLARGARYGDGSDADRPLPGATELGAGRGVVAPGLTAEFRLDGPGAPPAPDEDGLLEIFVHQALQSGQTVLTFHLTILPTSDSQSIPVSEIATLPLPAEPGKPVLLILPSAFDTPDQAIAIRARFIAPPGPGTPEAPAFDASVLAALTEATEASARARARAEPLSAHALAERAANQAMRNSDDVEAGRRTLLVLAQATGATLAEDLIMLAPPSVFLAYRPKVIEELSKQKGEAEPLEIGWILEAWACRIALQAFARGEVGEAFATVGVRRAGEVGRHIGLLRDLAEQSNSIAEFDRRLIAENFTFLLDSEPASRVWACDWLEERGLVPPGYDPLGSDEERRSALLDAFPDPKEEP